jgi:hypothetical protein
MKTTYILLIIIFSINNFASGIKNNYKSISKNDIEVLNDLCSTLLDSKKLMLINPFITTPVDFTIYQTGLIDPKYGFNTSKFEYLAGDTLYIKQNPKQFSDILSKNGSFNLFSDTLLINFNNFFEILSTDTVIKYESIAAKTPKDYHYENPLLKYIKNNYKGKYHRLCTFSKVLFSENSKYAIVHYYIYCGNMCADGGIVLMKKTKNKWIIINTLINIIA